MRLHASVEAERRGVAMLSKELEMTLNEAFRHARSHRHEFMTVEHLQHDACRFLTIHGEEHLQHLNNEIHRRVVVVEQHHFIHGRRFQLGPCLFYCQVTLS